MTHTFDLVFCKIQDSSGKGQLPATEVFTVYIKSLGSWSAALRAAASGAEAAYKPETLLVDADGFYGHLESYTSIRNAQAERIMIFAGGAGMTSFMGHVQVLHLVFTLSSYHDWHSPRT